MIKALFFLGVTFLLSCKSQEYDQVLPFKIYHDDVFGVRTIIFDMKIDKMEELEISVGHDGLEINSEKIANFDLELFFERKRKSLEDHGLAIFFSKAVSVGDLPDGFIVNLFRLTQKYRVLVIGLSRINAKPSCYGGVQSAFLLF
jgi:hypothetical protein